MGRRVGLGEDYGQHKAHMPGCPFVLIPLAFGQYGQR